MQRKRSLGRRLVLAGIMMVLMISVVEIASALIYWFDSGAVFSYDLVERMQIVAAGERRNSEEGRPTGKPTAEEFRELLDSMYNTAHPYLGYVYTPEFNREEFKQYQHRLDVSKFGFVDDKTPIRKRGDDRVIVGIVGGSVALLFSLAGDEVLAAELAGHPRFKGKKIEFVRMALGGYKQPQQLLAVSYLLSLGAEFDVLLNIDGFNEIALPEPDNVRVGVYPFFPSLWKFIGAKKWSREQHVLVGRQASLESQRTELARSFLRIPTKYSVTLQLIWVFRDRACRNELAEVERELLESPPGDSDFAATGPGIEGFSAETLHARLAEHWKESSVQLHGLCRANGIAYLHFLQPNQYVEGSKQMGAEERRVAIAPASDYAKAVRRGYPELLARGVELRRQGVDFHDLTRLFEDYREPLYTDDCCHFNARGNQIMAKRIAAEIRNAMDRASLRDRKITGLAAIPDEVVISDPSRGVPLRLRARFVDGTERDVTPAALGASLAVLDPSCVSLSRSGVLHGLRSGETVVTVTRKGTKLRIPVRVRFDPVISTWPGIPGTGRHTPVLAARFDTDRGSPALVVELRKAFGGANGALVISRKQDVEMREGNSFPLACSGEQGVPGAGFAALRIPLPSSICERGQVAYCRAFVRDPAGRDGWSASNTLRVEMQ